MPPEGTADLLLHPVRLRIVQAFLGGRTLTTGELREALPDVPAATLYRQVATLAAHDVLRTVGERRVRGAVERTYRLHEAAASVDADAAASMSPEEHRRAFRTFVAQLLADFDGYLDAGGGDLGRDLGGYRQNAFHVTDDELTEFLTRFRALFAEYAALGPGPDRVRRLLTTVLLPSPDR
ncbi:helix-turn-helix domain-containing protein [Micromonospora siamensis]|uniref:Helix-turn-helix domain-containing protein n=1 Tax=Micromonospora siamensis TaxID=299152 RepID=A0A1C5HDQ6_9ACTN|nr:helix-turn-helix domain-containing protein [Micromonospora siamensis]SCG43987.1 Helix-turn-helix domain-containing protein [Micromonospora siamensis]